MASKTIKGLTVEIGGDTTKLGKALKDVEAKSRSLSKELGDINKLLKMDPGNADLLAQKQKVLAEAVAATAKKLETLKEAEKQVQAQFERGEVSEEQLRALQREIVATENKMKGYEKAARQTAEAAERLGDGADEAGDGLSDTGDDAKKAAKKVDDFADAAEKAEKSGGGLGKTLAGVAKAGLTAVGAAVTAAITGLVAAAEASREYRTEMGKLDTAFTQNGHTVEAAHGAYTDLVGILGETDQSVEAANHLAKLTDSEKDLATWTGDILPGVFATFGDSLPIEGLTEAANETAKVGQVTGPLADALNWAGVSEDKFNESLAKCTSEQERQALITETLAGLYGEASEAYKETNAEVIRANQANDAWMQSLAGVGGAVEPIITDVKMMGAALLSEAVPGVQSLAEAFRDLMSGDAGAADRLGAALSGIITQLLGKVTELAPTLVQVAVSLIGALTTSLLRQLPAITQTLLQILGDVLGQLSSLLPQVATTVVEVVPLIVASLLQAVPDLVAAAASLITSLADALPGLLSTIVQALPGLMETLCTALVNSAPLILGAIVQTVQTLVGMLPVLIPQIVKMVTSIITMLTQQLPVLLPQIVQALVSIVTLLTEQLPVIIPMLIDACISIVTALIQALPTILSSLLQALPSALQAVWDAVVMVFLNLPAWFGQLFQGAVDIIASVFSAVGEFFSGIWADICGIFAPAADWFGNIFSNAWKGVKNAFSGAKSFFSGIWSGIKNAFSSVTSWFKNTFSAAWTAVKNVFSTGGKIFDGIKDGIANVFKTVVNGIIGGINKVIAVPFNAINSALKRIKGIKIVGIKPFSWIQTFDVPQLPLLAKGGVLERGQVGLLEGDGAEAVVPLEKNTEWLQKVARELSELLTDNMAGLQIERGLHRRANPLTPAISAVGDVSAKLDKILVAIERGQILTIDGRAFVGATANGYDNILGQRRALVARGAL